MFIRNDRKLEKTRLLSKYRIKTVRDGKKAYIFGKK